MKHANFTTPEEMCKFVADNSIVQSKIVDIFWKEGRWYLFYFI
jgi:hypothetical protein